MITSLLCLSLIASQPAAQGAKLVEGRKWGYDLTWHYKNKEIDTMDQESFSILVTKVRPDSCTIEVTQKLDSTVVDGNVIPTDPNAAPAKNEWSLFSNGAMAFMKEGRFALESRFYRILKSILPEPKGDPSRDREWTIDFPDDGNGMPAAALVARFSKKTKEGDEYFISYREGTTSDGTNGIGHFIRTEKSSPFPALLEVHFTNTRMPGGTDIVDCDFFMRPKAEKKN